MKKILIVLFSLLAFQFSHGQNPSSLESLHFTTQAQVDSFPISYPGYSEIIGNLIIGCEETTNINNLNALSQISSVSGSLQILKNPLLTNLAGLHNISTVGWSLLIAVNESLLDLSGLINLNQIGGGFDFHNNNQILNFEGLNTLESIGMEVWISGNDRLSCFQGMEGLQSIGGHLWINWNDALVSLEGLNNLEAASIDDLIISHNPLLSACHVESICNYLSSPNGEIDISVNAASCNSPEDVVDACWSYSKEIDEPNFLSIFPNPSQHSDIVITLGTIIPSLHLTCLNAFGQPIHHQNIHSTETVINISNWQPGIYIGIVYEDEKLIARAKFVVQ